MTRIIDGRDILFVSKEILQEVFYVMARPKFNVNHSLISHFISSIEEIACPVLVLEQYRAFVETVTTTKYWNALCWVM